MKSKYIIIFLLFISIGVGVGIYVYNNNKAPQNDSTYEATRTAANNTSQEDSNTNEDTQTEENKPEENETTDESTETKEDENTTPEKESATEPEPEQKKEPVETEIASYTSKIKQKKDSDRQNNITLACNTLNNTIIENGKTFSFCNTIGKTTKKKGYEEANVFQDGKEVEAVGGGLCQVSSTLYNAVLKLSSLKVVERHTHSKQVYYVPKGKDAAVAYGSYDFKFKNNTGSSIKIKASNTQNNVTIKLLKIE